MLFIGPAVLLLAFTRIVPVFQALADTAYDPAAGVYLSVYRDVFSSGSFRNSLRVTLWFNLIINPGQILLALALALLLTQKIPGVGLWRTVIFLPVAVPQAVSTIVWGFALRPSDGVVNSLLGVFGISQQPFLTSPQQALYSIMLIASWIGVGYWMTFLIAGLRDIPTDYLEAAAVDGAGWWRRLFYIVLPLLRRPLLFVLVANTVANFLLFVPVQILTKGGPAGSTNLLMHEIYRQAFTFGNVAFANAQVLVLTFITLVIVAVQFRLLQAAT